MRVSGALAWQRTDLLALWDVLMQSFLSVVELQGSSENISKSSPRFVQPGAFFFPLASFLGPYLHSFRAEVILVNCCF